MLDVVRRRCALTALAVLAACAQSASAQLVINELLASNVDTNVDEDGDSSDWVELLNVGDVALNLENHALSDDPQALRKWPLPPLTVGPGGRLLVWCSGKDRHGIDPERLERPDSSIPFVADLIDLEDEWSYLTGAPEDGAPPAGWADPEFDDSTWPRGLPGFGFGDDDDRTVIEEPLSALFLRRRFEFNPASGLSNLILQVRYDDAFILYLNGTRILSENFPANEDPSFASQAIRATEARRRHRFDLSERIGDLRSGENVAAIAVINSSPTSGDLSMIPELGTVPTLLHTSFRLEADGEWIFVTDPRGEVIDGVRFPPQVNDQSYGRSPDGTGEFRYNLEPTPLAPNAGPTANDPLVVKDTRFEPDRGFPDQPFDVVITTGTEDAVIRYTLDGSAPTETTGIVYREPIHVADTTTIRAAAFRDGLRATNVDAHTYIFLDTPDGGGVLNQPRRPPGFPPTWGSRTADYEMDPRIATNTEFELFDPGVSDGLLSLPTLSLVMDVDDLFDPRTGIYSNSQREGVEWERPTSVELIYPDGRPGFQVNAGLRIQGNASRNPNRPKHNMRLLFKRIYGDGKLRFPFFEDSPVEEFDTIILRGGNGDSWFHPNTTQQVRAQYIRDQWHRDTQRDMERLTTHQVYMHLYMNGLYWGLYHVFERPNASFLASYLGGEKEEYDSRNAREVVDGDLAAWNEMWRIANSGVAGAIAYQEIQEYLDVPNLVDFLLVNFYSGNVDWDNNNWFGGRRREPGGQYRFFCWDAERTYWSLNEDRTRLNNTSRPTGVHQRLRANPEYRLLFGDRIHRHFFNGGALTPEATEARWMERAREIESALSAEAARWGDNKRPSRPYTRDVEWRRELDAMQRNWFPQRTSIVLGQLRSQGLYSAVEAPSLSRMGGTVPEGFGLRITSPSGTVRFTLDGTDPRLPGGDVSPSSEVSTGAPIPIERNTRVMARVVEGARWSQLVEAVFVVPGSFALRITEIMYHPAPPQEDSGFDADDLEFLELKNVGSELLELRGVRVDGGVRFDFGSAAISTLDPGAVVVLVENQEGFASRYDLAGLPVAGEYDGRLSDTGEAVRIVGPLDETIIEVVYDDAWHPGTDGEGHSLVIADENAPWDQPANATTWTPSTLRHGTPGRHGKDLVEGGGQLPGDISQDGSVDLTDIVSLARQLFGGDEGPQICDDTAAGITSRESLRDINGDEETNISDVVSLASFLFSGGDEPFLGTACRRLPGCAEICAP